MPESVGVPVVTTGGTTKIIVPKRSLSSDEGDDVGLSDTVKQPAVPVATGAGETLCICPVTALYHDTVPDVVPHTVKSMAEKLEPGATRTSYAVEPTVEVTAAANGFVV